MRISLNLGKGDGAPGSGAAPGTISEADILAARDNDWGARNKLIRQFTPLISSLAQKRSDDVAEVNRCIEAGKQGLLTAIRKYKRNIGAARFRLFALDFIEKSMDGQGGTRGFFSRLFGRPS